MREIDSRLSGFAKVSEIFKSHSGEDWVRGHLTSSPAVFEVTFSDSVKGTRHVLPGTEVVYLQVCLPHRDVFEFYLGKIVAKPVSQMEFSMYVAPFILRLRDYHHVQASSFNERGMLPGRF